MKLVMAMVAAGVVALPAAAADAPYTATPWQADGPMDGGNDKTNPFPVRRVARGDVVRGLPMAARQIAPAWRWQDKDWTVDAYMAAYNVSGVLVLKDGQVVLERYAQGRQPTDRWVSQSVAKSVTSLLAGAAIQDGRLKLTDTVAQHVPELAGSAYAEVTVRQLLTMSSGVKWNEAYLGADNDLRRFYMAAMSGDSLTGFMAKLPRERPAGSKFHYNTAETHLAGIVVSRAAGKPLATYLSEKIWRPYGMERDAAWRVDPKGREFAGCCLLMTLGDFARLGQFVLDDGVANGERILPEGWIAESTSVQIGHDRPLPAGYGYFWWIGANAFEASGIYGQSILIYPKDKVVIAINSQWPKPDGKELFDGLIAFQRALHDAAMKPAD